MSETLKHARFIKSNVSGNNNKFWYITLFDNASTLTEFGRVGSNPQKSSKSFGSQSAAESFYDKKVKEKQSPRKGYTQLKVLTEGQETQQVASGSLTDIALKQIESNSPETAKLIKYLSKKNIHNIVSSTTIEFDESKGTFSTPCGIVTQEGIDEARELLGEISTYVKDENFDAPEYVKFIQDYIQLIPRKVGRKLIISEVIPNEESVQKESQILDALTASLQQVLTNDDVDDKKVVDAPKVFDVKVDVVNDQSIIDHIIKFFNKTRNSMHTSSNLRVKKVYSINIAQMHEAYEAKGKNIGNEMELWHGTRVENVLSILKGGLLMPKNHSGHVTGAMFSTGLYFSDQSTKSLNYSQGYWNRSRGMDNNCFMFLANVAMGKYFIPDGPRSDLPKKGYDSTFAKAHKSGVMNNEMVIYDVSQCDLTYLVEFSS